ncbi:Rpn family recombination-promoting nuclease/putative transposase [Virgibacillus sp. MSJ-26]|uniref:Rpn family recombination-promoting nuclease/putative transposase n=1 Tax=Virgibacillus sp. MSJ-26 TaxID=2841522 RepID=UPI00353053B6
MAAMPLLIKEDSSKTTYTKHDQLFKELINTFIKEFLEVFFPDVHDNIDLQAIKPIRDEVYTDMIEGSTRRLDIVVETTLKGKDVAVIVHIEPQSYKQDDFHERMYHYFSLLYNKYQKPIIPIAVFSYEEDWEEKQYTMKFPFFNVLTFNYMTLHLRKKNWRNYIRSDNPAAAALLSKMGYTEKERVQVKKEFLRMITRMELNPAKERLIYGFFETYLQLTEEEEEELMKEVENLPKEEAEWIKELPISYEEKGKAKAKKEVAMEMLRKGLDMDLIAEVTHLDMKDVEKLKEQL